MAEQLARIFIKNGTVVNADKKFRADVVVEKGKIVKVGLNLDVDEKTCDKVIPGGIDPHTHMELPFMGETAADDFFKGSQAAAAGGTTMIIDFVIPSVGKSVMGAFKDWEGKANERCGIDYGFHVALTWWSEEVAKDMETLVKDYGVNSFKMFLAYKNMFMLEDEGLINAFIKCKQLGALAMVHAENGELVERGQKKIFDLGITGPEGHPLSRPPFVEDEATNRAVTLARYVNNPLYVVHVSSKGSADIIAAARMKGQRVWGEPVAAFLGCEESKMWSENWREAAAYVMSPPIRNINHQKALIGHLTAGTLSLVGTDNCTFQGRQKALGKNDFRKIPNGVNGVEDRLSVVYEKCVISGEMTDCQFVNVTSTMAAKLFNIYPQKGSISVGADADIVIFDPKRKRVISRKTHHHAVDWNIFEGMEVHGCADVTISNGRIVWIDGKLNLKKGSGRYVKCAPFAPICFDGLKEKDSALQKKLLARKVDRLPYNPDICSCAKKVCEKKEHYPFPKNVK